MIMKSFPHDENSAFRMNEQYWAPLNFNELNPFRATWSGCARLRARFVGVRKSAGPTADWHGYEHYNPSERERKRERVLVRGLRYEGSSYASDSITSARNDTVLITERVISFSFMKTV